MNWEFQEKRKESQTFFFNISCEYTKIFPILIENLVICHFALICLSGKGLKGKAGSYIEQ